MTCLSHSDLLAMFEDGAQLMTEFVQRAGIGQTPTPELAKLCYKAGTWTGKSMQVIKELQAEIQSEKYGD